MSPCITSFLRSCWCSGERIMRHSVLQGGIKYFTSWEPILSAINFTRNSGNQTRQKAFKIAVIWELLAGFIEIGPFQLCSKIINFHRTETGFTSK